MAFLKDLIGNPDAIRECIDEISSPDPIREPPSLNHGITSFEKLRDHVCSADVDDFTELDELCTAMGALPASK